MKKIELDHITPYIAYDVEIEILNYKSDYTGIKFSKLNGYYILAGKPHFTYVGGNTGKSFSEFKLILKSLNDITKPQLKKLQNIWLLSNITTGVVFKNKIPEVTTHTINSIPHKAVQYLIELNYDIFGLIESGFAHNKKTFKKQNHEK